MKTVNLYLFAAFAAFLLIGCEDKSEELQEVFYPTNVDYGNTPLGLSSELKSIAGDGVTNEAVTLYAAKQMPWRFSGLPSWLSFSQQSGMGNSNLTYTAKPNPSVTVERTAYFFLESELGNLPLRRTLSAHQQTQPKTFTVTPDEPSYTFGHEGGTLELNVKSNRKWSISRATGEVAFAKLSHTEDSADAVVTVTVPPYKSLVTQTFSNTFRFVDASSTNVLYEFKVNQIPSAISTEFIEETVTFNKEGESQSLSLGIAPSYTVQCDLAWADVTPTSGIGAVELNISTLPNWSTSERSGYAYVYVEGELKAKILLRQEARQFVLHKDFCHVAADGGTVTFDMLTSDGTWQAVAEADWVKVTPTTGDAGEKQTISFTVSPNNSLDGRTATVRFERTDGSVASAMFTLSQEGRYFNADDWKDGIALDPDAQTASCEFDCNLAWTASTNVSWISLEKTSGSPTDGNTLLFTVTANSTQESRVGEILVSYDGEETKILVVQAAAYLNTSSEVITFVSTGGSHVVSISSNSAWEAKSNVEWLTISKKSGNGQIELMLTAADNPSDAARTAEVILTLGVNGVQRKLAVSQKGRYLNVPVTKVRFYKKGGEERFVIDSDGKLEVSSSESWLKATVETGNILVLNAAKMTSNSERSATITVQLSDLTSGELKHFITVYQTIESLSFTVNGKFFFYMIPVWKGTFTMGATSEQAGANSNEKPTHTVTLAKSYYIGETEVTQQLYEAVMGYNPSYHRGSSLPVERVSWEDCQTFIAKLNSLKGLNFRLPTEAEWEFAARGGNLSMGYTYSGSNSIGDVAWFTNNCDLTTHNVKTKAPNELGIYDMNGNVWEWCQDWYGSYSSSSQTDPNGPTSGSSRVLRGGGWSDNAVDCRVTNRISRSPSNTNFSMGFRLALTIE